MAVSDWIEKLGRMVFEAPFGTPQISKDAPELAEIRLAVLDEVKAKSHRVGGREVFPYNLVRINIRGIPDNAFFGRFSRKSSRRVWNAPITAFPMTCRSKFARSRNCPV